MTLHMISHVDKLRSEGDAPALMAKAETDKEGVTHVIASTSTVDRAGDIVEQDWRLKDFRKNPVILWMHNRMQPPVGRAVKISTGGAGKAGQLEMDIEWDTETEIGAIVAGQYARGFLHAVSVGFMPGSRVRRAELAEDDPRYQKLPKGTPAWMSGLVLSRNVLLENSAVTVPANPEALAVRAWANEAEDPAEQVRRAASEVTTRDVVTRLLEALKDPELGPAIQGALLAMPEPLPEPEPIKSANGDDWWGSLPSSPPEADWFASLPTS